jgi:chromate transporter
VRPGAGDLPRPSGHPEPIHWSIPDPAREADGYPAAAFIIPGLILILALAMLFLAGSPPQWVKAAGAGAGAVVVAVAVRAGRSLIPASWRRAPQHSSRIRWSIYLAAGIAAAATLGPWLVLILLACGLIETLTQRLRSGEPNPEPQPSIPQPGLAAASYCPSPGSRSRSVLCPTAAVPGRPAIGTC